MLLKDSAQHDLRCNVSRSDPLTVYIDKGSTYVGGVVGTAFITRVRGGGTEKLLLRRLPGSGSLVFW